MSLVQLKTELRQELKLTPQLMQSMEVLQMTSQELLEYIGRMAEENPLLDQADPPEQALEALRRQASWMDGGPGRGTFVHEEAAPEAGAADRDLESLAAFLRDQLHRLRLEKPLKALCDYLAELVDEDGYLAQEDLEGLTALKIPQALVDRALETLQSLEPPGVGARSLSECLLLQLSRREGADPVAMDIAARFLPELGRKHYAAIAQKLGVRVEAVRAAEAVIASLEPHPGRVFQPAAPEALYIRPDVFVAELEGELRVILNDYYLPRVSINGYYTQLLKDSDEKETRDYLRQKLQQAKWLLDSLERRGSTLRRCAQAVLEAQRPFFAGETGSLAPMTLSALAERLELHASTVSRAIRGKYLQCRQGTYPLRYFFSRPVSGGQVSRQAVKQALLLLFREEDPRKPLSDQALCGLLEGRGILVARRTVTKYRLELGVGSSAARRK